MTGLLLALENVWHQIEPNLPGFHCAQASRGPPVEGLTLLCRFRVLTTLTGCGRLHPPGGAVPCG